ncbi:hypothetical protein BCR34DRAFT_486436 [Clohesyomyces aquaticus]|uniref:Uncharacterized protein n=1 Tax=Clohesyomyces aquaticus TaxID=1231657 RepID=A0A1Y1ZIG9_9PLEO|nr:hypothetical protein BCR34DRAFT_486436 [Clohesyomyces aquaticus]
MVELFSLLGFPARVAGRALLVFRYVTSGVLIQPRTTEYGERRFGKSVKWRPWIMIDVQELEELEDLINRGTDAQVESWRVSQLSVCGMIAIIGALVAGLGLTALQLPSLEETHYVARGTFTMSLIMSLASVFFSGLQQSSFGRTSEPKDIRHWLSSGVRWDNVKMRQELESSVVAHMILHAPFEIVVMSITLFIVGLGTYLGSGWHRNVTLDVGSHGNRAVLIAFVIPTVFVLVMYGHMMGLKDRELRLPGADVGSVQVLNPKLQSEGEGSATDLEIGIRKGDMGVVSNLGIGTEGFEALASALKEAAEVHRRCAEADEEVAKRYERLLQR